MHILENEQCGLSGYTEKPLDADSRSLHIDHFRKRQLFNTDIFNWNNFIVDEKDTPYGANAKDGKNGVKSREEYSMIINPVEEDPNHYFKYMIDGQIAPSDGLDDKERFKAQHTIDIFNLNHSLLRELRKAKINQVRYLKNGKIPKEIIAKTLHDTGFPSVIEYFCRQNVFPEL